LHAAPCLHCGGREHITQRHGSRPRLARLIKPWFRAVQGLRTVAVADEWSRDVTLDIADEMRRRSVEYDEVPASVLRFLETASRH